jgi:hypothetical protein
MQMTFCTIATQSKYRKDKGSSREQQQRNGPKINISKTKDLRVNGRITQAFRIGEEVIERVENKLVYSR